MQNTTIAQPLPLGVLASSTTAVVNSLQDRKSQAHVSSSRRHHRSHRDRVTWTTSRLTALKIISTCCKLCTVKNLPSRTKATFLLVTLVLSKATSSPVDDVTKGCRSKCWNLSGSKVYLLDRDPNQRQLLRSDIDVDRGGFKRCYFEKYLNNLKRDFGGKDPASKFTYLPYQTKKTYWEAAIHEAKIEYPASHIDWDKTESTFLKIWTGSLKKRSKFEDLVIRKDSPVVFCKPIEKCLSIRNLSSKNHQTQAMHRQEEETCKSSLSLPPILSLEDAHLGDITPLEKFDIRFPDQGSDENNQMIEVDVDNVKYSYNVIEVDVDDMIAVAILAVKRSVTDFYLPFISSPD
eukprot:g67379.t1